MSETVTEKDLELLSTPDTEIVKQSQKFSFDSEKFSERIRIGERWQELMLCQIYLEHVVAELLRDAIPFPDEISFSRMPFGPRLDLARALDLLPSDIVAAIRRITKMRNHVAHNLSFDVTDSEVKELENCTPAHLRQTIIETKDRVQGSIQLFELLEVIVIMTEIFRQRHVADRLLVRKSRTRLRTVLDKMPNARYVK